VIRSVLYAVSSVHDCPDAAQRIPFGAAQVRTTLLTPWQHSSQDHGYIII
jgi:hypothetical protein